jgi:hypothetical protein
LDPLAKKAGEYGGGFRLLLTLKGGNIMAKIRGEVVGGP